MLRKRFAFVAATAVITGVVGIVPAAADHGFPYVTIDAAPEGAEVAAGEHFEGVEMTNTRPLAAGGVGSLPVFFADDEYGCNYATAAASGESDWIALARRGLTEVEGLDQCAGFQTKVTTATAAGADGLIVINHSPGAEAGTAAGEIPALMIDHGQGNRLVASLDPAKPDTVKVTLDLLDPDTFLPGHPMVPSKVNSVQASSSGTTVSVSGTASFGGVDLRPVGSDPSGDAVGGAPPALGYDLTGARIGQPDPTTGDFQFVLDLVDLPPTGGLPEAARYIWDFAVAADGPQAKVLSVEGKFTDVLARQSTDMPTFVLRGNCVTENNVITCEDIATLDADMNPAANRITVTVPQSVIAEQAQSSLQGARIEPADICEGISAKVSARFSLCGGAGENLGDLIVQDPDLDVYPIATQAVRVGIVPTGSAPAFTTNATVAPNGSFAGSIGTSGLGPGTYDVWAQACFGSNCGATKTTITL